MDHSFRSGLSLLAGLLLLAGSAIANALIIDSSVLATVLLLAGLPVTAFSLFRLRHELRSLVRQGRGEMLLSTVGLLAVLVAVAWIATLYPARLDMTADQEHSLSPQTISMLKAIDKPVDIVFFHDRGMRETVELYEQIASRNPKINVRFFDPLLNPSQAKLLGVEFAGTALMESEGRKLTVNGPTETDIANGILRVTQGKQQLACFLDGHGEPDPFSLESHDHTEGDAGHSHGLETKLVQHERHGMAKARGSLEAMNYVVDKVNLLSAENDLSRCSVLLVIGPAFPLLEREVATIERFLVEGGNAMFLLDPFVQTGLEKLLVAYGLRLADGMVIDEASHFWADISAPAVSDYNRHEITQKLPLSFFPGVRAIQPTAQPVPGVAVRPLVNSSRASYVSSDKTRPVRTGGADSAGPQTLMVVASFNPDNASTAELVMRQLRGESPDADSPAVATADRKPSRIVVAGDADFATNSYFHVLGNGALFLNAVNFLASRENLIGVEPRTYDLPYVHMTNTQMKGTFLLSIIFVPALMALLGVLVWWRRR